MRALVIGANGQVGRALLATAPAGAEVIAADRAALDITDDASVRAFVTRTRPDVIFNAAAYTAVDRAEHEEDQARAINATAVASLRDAAAAVGARLVHLSTDFVFDGTAAEPYPANAKLAPMSAYGRSKRAGEHAAGPDALIVRTAWVYGEGANFVATMLKLMRSRDEIRVVDDQVGTPTWATSLAEALWRLALDGAAGVHHFTDSGEASWYDFAVAIQEEALAAGLLDRAIPVIPISTADYPTAAVRPAYSVLDKRETFALLGSSAPHWRVNLRQMLKQQANHG